jgi:hypothetical protein
MVGELIRSKTLVFINEHLHQSICKDCKLGQNNVKTPIKVEDDNIHTAKLEPHAKCVPQKTTLHRFLTGATDAGKGRCKQLIILVIIVTFPL